MSKQPTTIGWYSKKQAKLAGTVIWLNDKGRQVTVSEVISSGEDPKWPDAVRIGEVTRFVKRHTDGDRELM